MTPPGLPGESSRFSGSQGFGFPTDEDNMAGKREVNAIVKKQLTQRDQLWPDAKPLLWDRSQNKGFATIPKTWPLILKIMDDMSNGKPLSSTYIGLWCATWDNSFVIINRAQEMAHAAGFTGQRAEYTWGTRMKLLQELGFIDIQPGRSGPITYAIIYNPHYVIRYHHEQKTPGLNLGDYNALLDRAGEIGAKDMLEGIPTPPETTTPPEQPVAAGVPSVAPLPPMPPIVSAPAVSAGQG
jgi:hypothetical protein